LPTKSFDEWVDNELAMESGKRFLAWIEVIAFSSSFSQFISISITFF